MATPTDPNAPSGPPDPPNPPAPAPIAPLPAGTAVIGAVQITDAGLTRIATVKAGSTAAAAVDPSLVVALSPNSPIPPGANAIGSVSLNAALPSGNNNIGDVDIVTMPAVVLAAGAALIGKVEMQHGKTLKTVVVDIVAETVIVAAVGGKRIKVFAFVLQSVDPATEVQFVSAAGSILLSGSWLFDAREGISLAVNPPAFLLATAAGDNLGIFVSGQVVGFVSYFDDDAT